MANFGEKTVHDTKITHNEPNRQQQSQHKKSILSVWRHWVHQQKSFRAKISGRVNYDEVWIEILNIEETWFPLISEKQILGNLRSLNTASNPKQTKIFRWKLTQMKESMQRWRRNQIQNGDKSTYYSFVTIASEPAVALCRTNNYSFRIIIM